MSVLKADIKSSGPNIQLSEFTTTIQCQKLEIMLRMCGVSDAQLHQTLAQYLKRAE